MRKQIIMGNWKMNGQTLSIKTLSEQVKSATCGARADVVVFPPAPYITYVASIVGNAVGCGAQNISQYNDGAYTGEMSVAMLQDLGCQYALVGHSERRSIFGESNQDVAEKTKKVLDAGVIAVVCIGETKDERLAGKLEQVLSAQVEILFNYLSNDELKRIILAYEPVWAIGTGLVATLEQIQEAHAYIRSIVARKCSVVAESMRIVYGGSLKPDNAKDILSLADVDGGLIGGAALDGNSFRKIIEQAK